MRRRTDAELAEAAKTATIVAPAETDLTTRTFSLALDVGMYLGEVVRKTFPNASWSQELGSRRNVDYGQPVLDGFGPVPMNPVRLAIVVAYKTHEKTAKPGELLATYQVWAGHRVTSAARR